MIDNSIDVLITNPLWIEASCAHDHHVHFMFVHYVCDNTRLREGGSRGVHADHILGEPDVAAQGTVQLSIKSSPVSSQFPYRGVQSDLVQPQRSCIYIYIRYII